MEFISVVGLTCMSARGSPRVNPLPAPAALRMTRGFRLRLSTPAKPTMETKMTELISKTEREELIENGRKSYLTGDDDFMPVVKLFLPDGAATWLLTEISDEDGDLAYGLCDLGLGSPEIGQVSLSEIDAIRSPNGLRVEKDKSFRAKRSLLEYARLARSEGMIID